MPFLLPAALFGGTIDLSGTSDPVAFQGVQVYSGTMLLGTCVASNCYVNGTATLGPAAIAWSLVSPWGGPSGYAYAPTTDSLNPTVFAITGGPATFSITETNLGGDTLSGTLDLSTLTETGDLTNATLSGTATVTAFTVTPGDPLTLALAAAGITGDGQTVPLSISVTNCEDLSRSSTTCIQNVDPFGSIASVSLGAVPEPDTFGVLALALFAGCLRKRYQSRHCVSMRAAGKLLTIVEWPARAE